MGGYGTQTYAGLTKAGFLFGLGLFLLGVGGETLGPLLFGSLPTWEETALFYSEGIGILIGLLAPFVFGVYLPLTE